MTNAKQDEDRMKFSPSDLAVSVSGSNEDKKKMSVCLGLSLFFPFCLFCETGFLFVVPVILELTL